MSQRIAMEEAKAGYATGMEPEQKKDPSVSLLPCRIRQGAPLRKGSPDATHGTLQTLAEIHLTVHGNSIPYAVLVDQFGDLLAVFIRAQLFRD
jgi:hypothetical protein